MALGLKLTRGKLFGILLVLMSVATIFFTSQIIRSKQQVLQIDGPQLITINKGESFYSLCKSFIEQKIVVDCFGHKIGNKLFSESLALKSGTYQIDNTMTLDYAVNKFIVGDEIQFSFTILEGENIYQVLDKVTQASHLVDDLTQLSIDKVAQRLTIQRPHPEGFLYPDTYFYTNGTFASQLLTRAVKRQSAVLDKLWQEKGNGSELSDPYQALILASIIEKESAVESERDVIASVFFNRLNKRMRLQTDPTVIYGVWHEYKGDITRRHLNTTTPYNTYRINGLPPTPIANPSVDSIEAALTPAQTDYLYFVANGDGSHYFSRSLKEHNQAVKRYLEKTKG